MNEPPMTPTELREIIERLDWKQGDLAFYAKRDEARIRKQARGSNPIDDDLCRWLRAVDAHWGHVQQLLDNPPILARRPPAEATQAPAYNTED
jgi:hypothetical protein